MANFIKIISKGAQTTEDKDVLDNWDVVTSAWKKDFQKLHRLREMRIYPHIIIDHGKDLLSQHGPLGLLSQQAFEHANKRDVLAWYRHSQHSGGPVKGSGGMQEKKNTRFLRSLQSMILLPYMHCALLN